MGESELGNDDDIEAILRIAVARSGSLDSQTLRQRLAASAAELGLTPEEVAEAEDQWKREQKERIELADFRAHQRRNFWELVAGCTFAGSFLSVLNLVTDRTVFWAIWPILGLCLGIGFGVVETFFPKSARAKEKFAQWRLQRRSQDGESH